MALFGSSAYQTRPGNGASLICDHAQRTWLSTPVLHRHSSAAARLDNLMRLLATSLPLAQLNNHRIQVIPLPYGIDARSLVLEGDGTCAA